MNQLTELIACVESLQADSFSAVTRMLEQEGILYRHYEPTVPPQVTYGLTDRGLELVAILDQLNILAERWYSDPLDSQRSSVS